MTPTYSKTVAQVPTDMNELAAAQCGLRQVCRIYVEDFAPSVDSLLSPTGIEQIFQFSAHRCKGLVASLLVLNGPEHVQSIAATVRLLFEIAIDVALVQERSNLGISNDPDDDTIRRHAVLSWCYLHTLLGKIERSATSLQESGLVAESLPAYVADTSSLERQVAEFTRPATMKRLRGKPCESSGIDALGKTSLKDFKHWLHLNLADRANLLDRLRGVKEFKGMQYDQLYHIASVLSHGAPSSIIGSPLGLLNSQLALICDWATHLLSAVIMPPLFAELQLKQSHPKAWDRIQAAWSEAQRTRAHFLANSAEIWAAHNCRLGLS
jgi:hypothetical protein